MLDDDPHNPENGGLVTPEPEPHRIDREAALYPSTPGRAWRLVFEDQQLTGRLFSLIDMSGERAFQRQRARVFGEEFGDTLSPDEANAQHGVPGYLTFDRPVSAAEAAYQQTWAQRRAYADQAVASSGLGWLEQMGAGFAGALLDPASLPLWLVPELAAGRAVRGGLAARGVGPLARGAAAGAAEGVAGALGFEALNLPLRRIEGDADYGAAEALGNVVLGGLLGAALGTGAGALERAARPPAAVRALPEEQRAAAFAQALDAVIEDRPVDLGAMVRRTEPPPPEPPARSVGPLDEASAAPTIGGRWLDEDVAVTTRGTEVPVRYALVELDDLVTSHTDDLFRDPAYPAQLQPRQRERAAAAARNRALEAELNPKRLLFERGAESGAPIVSPDGVVESGNGRAIALRRSAVAGGTDAYARYRAELEAQGLDTTGMNRPVLVRMRTQALSGEERARLARDMNADVTERYSATEQAMSDAEALDDATLALMDGPDPLAATNRPFVRRFIDTVAPDQMNALIDPGGGLSKAGVQRVRAALVARAYGDEALVEALFEAGDDTAKGIGRALADAAPAWAAMRAAIARGEVPAELDTTDALRAAVAFVRHARERRIPVGELVAQRLGQLDAFSGEAISPETEAFLRAFFQTSKDGETLWNRPRAADKLAAGLSWLARETMKAQPGPNLFGDVANASDARRLLDGLAEWFARQAEPEQHPLALAGADEAAGGHVRGDGGEAGGDGLGRERRPEAGGQPEGEGGGVKGQALDDPRPAGHTSPFAWHESYGTPEHWAEFQASNTNLATAARYQSLYGIKPNSRPTLKDAGVSEAAAPPPKADPLAADPELRALADDTEALIAREGLELGAPKPADQPEIIAEAIRAAAFCLKAGGS